MQNDDSSFAGSRRALLKTAAALTGTMLLPFAAHAAEEKFARLNRESKSALKALYSRNSAAKALGAQATAVLVFPRVTKAGFVVGGQYGDGALLKGGNPVGYYSTAGISAGMQAGAQAYGYAMFFMNDNALAQLDRAGGFEIGVGPSIVVVAADIQSAALHLGEKHLLGEAARAPDVILVVQVARAVARADGDERFFPGRVPGVLELECRRRWTPHCGRVIIGSAHGT